jgi:hypothetical protein
MQKTFVVIILFCVLSIGLGSCGSAPERVDMIADGDTSFMVFCSASTCGQRAASICHTQGYSHYDVLDQLKGDDLGEGRGIVIQCKA